MDNLKKNLQHYNGLPRHLLETWYLLINQKNLFVQILIVLIRVRFVKFDKTRHSLRNVIIK